MDIMGDEVHFPPSKGFAMNDPKVILEAILELADPWITPDIFRTLV